MIYDAERDGAAGGGQAGGDPGRAEGVAGAENRNKGDGTARPGGVAASMAAAARLNRDEAVWDQ